MKIPVLIRNTVARSRSMISDLLCRAGFPHLSSPCCCHRLRDWFVRHTDALGICPKPLQRVMLPNIVPEDMSHDVAEIDQDPRGRAGPFHAQRSGTG